jgi:superfamily II DNA/RNA helicase
LVVFGVAGLGAVIISPTRELSVQIFEVLKKIGSAHSFSAGLIIGGKDKNTEAKYLHAMNILVATPGQTLKKKTFSFILIIHLFLFCIFFLLAH